MSEQSQTPPTGDQSTEREYEVNARGEVNGFREPEQQTDGIFTREAQFKNGVGRIDDPVLVDGRRGTVKRFPFLSARAAKKEGRPGGFNVEIELEDGTTTTRNPANVDLLLDELKRPAAPEPDPDLYPIPTDRSFDGKETKLDGELLKIGQDLIETTEDFNELRGRAIDYVWLQKGGTANKEPIFTVTRPLSKFEKRTSDGEMMVCLSANHLRNVRASRELVEAFIHDALCLIGRSKRGRLFVKKPDFVGNTANVVRYGALLPKAKVAVQALARDIQDVRNLRLDLDAEVEVGV